MEKKKLILSISKFSIIESEILELKSYVTRLESDRLRDMLKTIQADEIRLKKCIDDVEVLHRDVFVLSNTENKTADAKSKCSLNDYVKKDKLSVTEQDFSMNQLEWSIVDLDYPMNQPESFVSETDYSINQPECSVIEPDYSMNQSESSMMEDSGPVNQLESLPFLETPVETSKTSETGSSSMNQSESSMTEDSDSVNQPESLPYLETPVETSKTSETGSSSQSSTSEESSCNYDELTDSKDESLNNKNESHISKDKSYDDDDKSYDAPDKSYDARDNSYDVHDKSDDNEGNSTDDREEFVKNALLDLLADREPEITKLVLRLIFTFSRFQRSLREVETNVSRKAITSDESLDNTTRILKRLSESVLYLDQTIYNIHMKYFEMLKCISAM